MKQVIYAVGSVVGRVPMLICLCLIGAVFTSDSQAQTFKIDNDHTSLVFAVSHSGLSYTYGRFNKCSGQITLNEKEDGQDFVFTIDTGSIDTNNLLRDEYLKGKEFFDAGAFPKIEFRSSKLTNDGDDFTAEGTLTMHGVKKDITIQLTKIGIGKGWRGKTRAGFFSKFSVKRSDYGINSLPTIVGDEVALTLSFEGVLNTDQQGADRQIADPQKKTKTKVEGSSQSAAGEPDEFGILEQ